MSYENSFSVIKKEVMKETIEKKISTKPKLAINLQFEPIDEKPAGTATVRGKGSNTSKVNPNNKSKDNSTISDYLKTANPQQFKNQPKVNDSVQTALRPKT